MAVLFVKTETRNGGDLDVVFAEMIALAERASAALRMDIGAACEVDGMPLHAQQGDTVADVRRLYDLMRGVTGGSA